MTLSDLQNHLPAWLKFRIKRYFRTFFPDRLIVLWNPTSRCNYRCSYCPVVTQFDYAKVFPRLRERSVDDWLGAFEKLPDSLLYIAGGEPFLYAGLVEFVNCLPARHQVMGIISNLSQDVRLYRKLARRVHLRASFHREYTNQGQFLEKIRALQDQFVIHVNIVATPENLPLIETIAREFKRRRVTLHVDPFIQPGFFYSSEQMEILSNVLGPDRRLDDLWEFKPKWCSAGRNYINVMPDGSVYTCNGGMQYLQSDLYRDFPNPSAMDLNLFRMGNLFDAGFQLHTSDMVCSLPCKEACDRESVRVC